MSSSVARASFTQNSGQQRRASPRRTTARTPSIPQASADLQALAREMDETPVSQGLRRNRYDDDERRPAVAANYDAYAALAQTQRDVVRTVEILQEAVQELAITVQALRSEMPTQASIQAEIDKRLPRDTYLIAHTALENEMRQRSQDNANDIAELKAKLSGAWPRAAPWVAIGVSLLGIFGSILMGGLTILAAILLKGSPLP